LKIRKRERFEVLDSGQAEEDKKESSRYAPTLYKTSKALYCKEKFIGFRIGLK